MSISFVIERVLITLLYNIHLFQDMAAKSGNSSKEETFYLKNRVKEVCLCLYIKKKHCGMSGIHLPKFHPIEDCMLASNVPRQAEAGSA